MINRPLSRFLMALVLGTGALLVQPLAAQSGSKQPKAPRSGPAIPTAQKNRHVIVISLDGFAAYALADPTLPLPNLRALAKAGVMAEGMTPVNPTVTWPNHTSIVTGVGPDRHGLLYNGLPVRRKAGEAGAPIRTEAHVDKTTLVQAPTVYDVAYRAGLTTAEVDWVAIEHAPTISWAFPEYGNPADTPLARDMIAAGVLTEAEFAAFGKAPITFRDEIWTRAGEFIIKTHKPNLLLLHLLATDSSQHQYGARSLGAATALALADAKVGRLVDACRAAGILPTTTFVILSDHGFKTYKKRIRANAVLKAKGLGEAAWAVPEGGTAMVYLTPAVGGGAAGGGAAGGAAAGDRARTIAAVEAALTGVEGIADILAGTAELTKYGYPLPEKTERMSDLVLVAQDGYGFDGAVDGEAVADVPAGANPGSHGYINTDPDMRAIFIASGAGVKKGAPLGLFPNVNVAPTIAHWLGVTLPDVAGKPLTEILTDTPTAPAGSR